MEEMNGDLRVLRGTPSDSGSFRHKYEVTGSEERWLDRAPSPGVLARNRPRRLRARAPPRRLRTSGRPPRARPTGRLTEYALQQERPAIRGAAPRPPARPRRATPAPTRRAASPRARRES